MSSGGDEKMIRKTLPFLALLLGVSALMSLGTDSVSSAQNEEDCQLTVREDIYFLPPSELADTKSYPEVLILENEELIVWAVPNRGRMIYTLILKETGHSQLLANPTPLPLRFQGVYTFEFGGLYTTFPWNKRDQQLLNLEFEVLQVQGTCAARMRSQDPETGVWLESDLELPPTGTELQLSLSLINPMSTVQEIPFSVVVFLQPGGELTEETALLLPVDVVTVGSSQEEWLGPEGAQVSWPAPWAQWGAFQGAGWFYADRSAFQQPALAAYNPQANETILVRWAPQAPWDRVAVFSWGPAYTRELGAYPAFRVELQVDRLSLSTDRGQSFVLHLKAQRGRPTDGFPGD